MAEYEGGGEGSLQPDLRRADDLAAAAMREVAAAPTQPAASKPVRRRSVWPIVTVVSVVVFITQLPSLHAAFKSMPSIRIGVGATDEDTDACIDTLWKISGVLQHRPNQELDLLEPASQKPYVVRHVDGDTIVSCPDPAAHSLRSLQVSSSHRAPEAKQ